LQIRRGGIPFTSMEVWWWCLFTVGLRDSSRKILSLHEKGSFWLPCVEGKTGGDVRSTPPPGVEGRAHVMVCQGEKDGEAWHSALEKEILSHRQEKKKTTGEGGKR